MSRRKWAWEAYHEGADTRSVEAAVVEDFADDVAHAIVELQAIAERTNNPATALGLELAFRALGQTRDSWTQ
jgi:hypothetical protein